MALLTRSGFYCNRRDSTTARFCSRTIDGVESLAVVTLSIAVPFGNQQILSESLRRTRSTPDHAPRLRNQSHAHYLPVSPVK